MRFYWVRTLLIPACVVLIVLFVPSGVYSSEYEASRREDVLLQYIEAAFQTPNWTATGEAAEDHFGILVRTAGDVNGDGFADVIIGAAQPNGTGQAYVYHGGPDGLSIAPDFTTSGETIGSRFGFHADTAGDVNGDGYDDVIIAAPTYDGNRGRVYVFHGGPGGLSSTPRIVATGENTNDYLGNAVGTAGDVNDDGYADIIIGTRGFNSLTGKADVYSGWSDGVSAIPSFTVTGEAANNWFGHRVSTAGDVNGDGYDDVIVGARHYNGDTGRAYVYQGGPNGLSTTPSFIATGETTSSQLGYGVGTAGDVNGDGFDDVIIGAYAYNNITGRAYVYHGGANGLNLAPAFIATGEAVDNYFGLSVGTAGDIDKDDYDDVIIGARGYNNVGRSYVYRGGPNGLSEPPDVIDTGEGGSSGYSVGTAGDVNGDGYDDIIVGAWGYLNTTGRAYLYYGPGQDRPFRVISTEPPDNGRIISRDGIVSATFSRDINYATINAHNFAVRGKQTGSYLGTYTFNSSQSVQFDATNDFKPGEEIVVNLSDGFKAGDGTALTPYAWEFRADVTPGSGVFVDSGQRLDEIFGSGSALGDLDGDNDLDVFVANAGLGGVPPNANTVWFNDGNGIFTDSGQRMGDFRSTHVALGDLDADGDLDAFVTNYNSNQPSQVWLNDGTGFFTDSGQSIGNGSSGFVDLGDIDSDGDLDAVINNHGPNTIWFNDGAGHFSESTQTFGDYWSSGVPLGDLDGDGDLDIFESNSNGPSTIWFNDGSGHYTNSGQSFGSGGSVRELKDLDSDGDLDAFMTVGNAGNTVWLNNGNGFFTDSGQALGSSDSRASALGDIDGDGDLDAVVGTWNQPEVIWLNDGTGVFSDSGQGFEIPGGTLDVSLGDLDSDGDLDVFFASTRDDQVWLNDEDATPPLLADLSITEADIVPIQVVENADVNDDGIVDLVLGKPMVVRVRVTIENFNELSDNQPITTELRYEDEAAVGTFLTVSLLDELKQRNLSTNPYELIAYEDFSSLDFPGLEPAIVGGATIVARVDTTDEIPESNEQNNVDTRDVTVKDTGGLHVVYLRVDDPVYLSEYKDTATKSGEFVKGVFPVEPDEVNNDVREKSIWIPDNGDVTDDLKWLWRQGKLTAPLANHIVGIVPKEYFEIRPASSNEDPMPAARGGDHPSLPASFVVEGYWTAAAHEIGHTYGLYGAGGRNSEQYEIENKFLGYWADSGYWVEKRETKSGPVKIFSTGLEFQNELDSGNLVNLRQVFTSHNYELSNWVGIKKYNEEIWIISDLVSGDLFPVHRSDTNLNVYLAQQLDIMAAGVESSTDSDLWHKFDRWISYFNYIDLFEEFLINKSDPEILLVSGIEHPDGTVELDPLYRTMEGFFDEISPGDHYLQLFDAGGSLIQEISFGIDHTLRLHPLPPLILDSGVFAFAIQYPKDAQSLIIRHNNEVAVEVVITAQLLRDAVNAIPDFGFIGDPEQKRTALHTEIDTLEALIRAGDFFAASDTLHNIQSTFSSWLIDDYEPENVLQYSKTEIVELTQEMTERVEQEIDNWPPTAEVGESYTSNEGSGVTLDASGSSDPDGSVTLYEWDLDNDGYYDNATGATTEVVFGDNGVFTVGLKVTDDGGLTDTATAEVTVNNVPPSATFTNASGDISEGESVNLNFSEQSDPSPVDTVAGFLYSYDCTNDGTFELTDDLSASFTCNYPDNGNFTARGRITDKDGGYTEYTVDVPVNNMGPDVGSISAPIDPVQVNTEINVSADFTDPGVLDTHTATWDWGDDSTSEGTVSEADGSGSVTGSHTYTEAGVYTVRLTVTDKDGDSHESIYQFVVVYDPEGGFVTGGGWIDSPEGACPDFCDEATGKATFGFVSKYKKGADVPTGNTEFQFKAGNLNFRSTSYQWLVVAGHKAQFKGDGTINGEGNYGFMLTAIDEDLTPSTDVDMFRIKIWDKDNADTVVYDNQMDSADDADPTTAIGGGSIVIHTDK